MNGWEEGVALHESLTLVRKQHCREVGLCPR